MYEKSNKLINNINIFKNAKQSQNCQINKWV